MVAVRSTAIADVEYDPEEQELTVVFHNGASYTHEGVPPEVYRQFVLSPSPGSFYNSVIKGSY